MGLLAAAWLCLCLCLSWPAHAADLVLTENDNRMGSVLLGILAGVLGTAACYLFFIWVAIRDRSQVSLILMLVALLVSLGLSNDLGLGILAGGNAVAIQFAQLVTLLVFYAAACLFTIQFLELDTYAPIIRRVLQGIIALLIPIFLLGALNTPFVTSRISIVGVAIYGALLLAGVQASRKNVPGAGTHMLAFALLIAATFNMMTDLNRLTVLGINIFYFASSAAALVFAIGIARQFSSRQEEKERQLSLSNERFALAALGSNEGLFDWDIEAKKAYFSDRFKKLVGRDLEPTSQGVDQWMQAIEPTQQERIRQDLTNFVKGDALTISFEYRVRRGDGQVRWLQTTAVPLRDGRGRARRLVGSTGDITERKQAEVGLKNSEARFRSIIEAHPVPVVIIALENYSFMYASPSVSDLMGETTGELVGRSAHDYFPAEETLLGLAKSLIKESHVEGYETVLSRKNKTPVPVALSARLIDFQNRAAAVIGITDLTERKEAQAQIEHQRVALEQSEKLAALGSLLAGVAHELNNPLSVVVGQSSLLLEGSSDPKIQTRADKIKKAAERCTRIVRNFLALARRKDPERKMVDINQVINQALDLLASQLRTDSVESKLNLMPGVPLVMADADQLHQIITNLVLNAKQALAERPEPRLITIGSAVDVSAQTVSISVSDNGPGVPADIRRRIFEPFFTTKTEGRGTGIGLSLSLGLAEAHHGSITYADTPGGGATFILTLPIGKAEVEPVAVPDVPLVKLPSLKILLVDDEPDVVQILADLMTNDRHQVTIAENGAVALQHLMTDKYDLIISDLRMPVMDGPTLYRTIKAELPHYVNRIFFVTGDTLSVHVRTFLEENPVLVIDKPYMAEDVRQAVQRQLKISGFDLGAVV